MIKNYLKIAWRNLSRNKIYSLINVVGLSIGIASCVLIFIFIRNELNYDKHWNDGDKIVRINQIFTDKGIIDPYAVTSFYVAPSLKENFPEIEHIVRIDPHNHQTVSYENKHFNEDNQYAVDPDFLEVFNFELLKGDAKTCLAEPNCVVISETMANKFFGTADPMGKMLQYPRKLRKITGVLKNTGLRSHLRPNALLSINLTNSRAPASNDWFQLSYFTYIKFKDKSAIADFDNKLKTWSIKYLDPAIKKNKFSFTSDLKTQALSDVYFDQFHQYNQFESGERKYLYIFGWVAIFILIIACFNYMNLSTARALKRSKEVGLRKVVGAERSQLIFQFLGESLVITLLGLMLSTILLVLSMPSFIDLIGKTIDLSLMFKDPYFWFVLLSIIMFISLVGGSYPAFYLSNFKPSEVLKGKLIELKNVTSFKGIKLRQLLVVGQFTISTVIIIATIMVYKQLILMKTKDLGFNKDQVVVLKFPSYMDSAKFSKIEPFKNDLLKNSSILNFATTEQFVGAGRVDFFIKDNGKDYTSTMNINWCDYNYMDLLGLKLIKGRNFDKNIKSDFQNFILNEEALRFLNWKDPLNREISLDGKSFGRVIGIMKNFNYKSPHTKIEPLALALANEKNATASIALIKMSSAGMGKSLDIIDQKWKSYFPENPVSRFFLNEKFDEQYKKDQTMLTLFTCFSGLTIFISCLGLLGLASYTTEQRVKEIGIRKVLGASISNIVYLISKDFMLLILIAIIVASPIAYYFINSWLQDFAYKTEINLWVFIFSGGLAVFAAFLSMSFQTLKAANSNPIKNLRTE